MEEPHPYSAVRIGGHRHIAREKIPLYPFDGFLDESPVQQVSQKLPNQLNLFNYFWNQLKLLTYKKIANLAISKAKGITQTLSIVIQSATTSRLSWASPDRYRKRYLSASPNV